jgi:hypothetical protein
MRTAWRSTLHEKVLDPVFGWVRNRAPVLPRDRAAIQASFSSGSEGQPESLTGEGAGTRQRLPEAPQGALGP